MTDELNLSGTDRKEAYNEVMRAKDKLGEAAEILGADGAAPPYLLAKADEEDVPADIRTGIRAVSSAYRHLDNGRPERLLPESEDDE